MTRRNEPGDGLSRRLLLLFAVASGLSVANVYAAQPLLDTMAMDLSIDQGLIGIVVTLTQIGYALGLIFIVPLGDLLDRRRLIVGQAVLSATALIVVGTASTATVLLIGMMMVGLLAVVVQVLVAFAAGLAGPRERGRAIGTVTSGVVVGILSARFLSGVVADLGGWRAVYLGSATLVVCMAALLHRALPRQARRLADTTYPALLRSTISLFLEEPMLRVRATFALLIFAAFSIFWSSIVLPLASPPFSLSHATIGLLGIAGVAGALAAGGAGRLADRGWARWTTGLSLVFLALAWIPMALLSHSVWCVVVGVVVLDLAVQAVHVTNQSLILATRPVAQSRLVAVYMVFYSIGSASGSIASTMTYAASGWTGVCVLGFLVSTCALLFWVVNEIVAKAPRSAPRIATCSECNV